MEWKALLAATKTAASMAGAMISHVESLAEQWSKAPPSAQEQRVEALAIIAQLQNSLSGALDRDDIRDLEAK